MRTHTGDDNNNLNIQEKKNEIHINRKLTALNIKTALQTKPFLNIIYFIF